MRVSQLLLPTVKEDPAGAEAVSHQLMVRAGLVRQLAAGIYVYLPAGWRVLRKIEQIIREEMDAIGCQEMLMPVLQPAEIWQESGRWDAIGDEMFRLKDRKGADMALAMTHEEVITWLAAREVHSYKQLPQTWYHFQTKERDEARPKSGILRTREFIMKDSYSLDVSHEALQESYRRHIAAYDRIYARCGVDCIMVEGDSGMMGGSVSHEYMAYAEAGEDQIVFCRECGYAANVELALAGADREAPADGPEPGDIHTPGAHTIAEVSAFLGLPSKAFCKALVVIAGPGDGGKAGEAAPAGPGTSAGASRSEPASASSTFAA
jgi:prolyl-tRNA synthetase